MLCLILPQMARLGLFVLTSMPQLEIKLTQGLLHLFWGTLKQDALLTELPWLQSLSSLKNSWSECEAYHIKSFNLKYCLHFFPLFIHSLNAFFLAKLCSHHECVRLLNELCHSTLRGRGLVRGWTEDGIKLRVSFSWLPCKGSSNGKNLE